MSATDDSTARQPLAVLPYASDHGATAVTKVMARLIPFMILLYFMNYLDRVNISFAKLQMNADLGLTNRQYGIGAGIFFIGYCLFEVPSNLIMQRVGARLWMARIMVTWGLVSVAMMFMHGRISFYTLRILLGIAEAGFFPGMVLYLSQWVPHRQRAKALSWFLTSTALAGVIGAPLSGQIMGLNTLGIPGWRWLFLIEGTPSIILGLVILLVLRDRPSQATWLNAGERQALEDALAAEHHGGAQHHRLMDGLAHPMVWALATVYASVIFGFYVVNFWTASVVKEVTGASNVIVATMSAIPFIAATLSMIVVGIICDHIEHRRAVVAIAAVIGGLGLFMCGLAHGHAARIAWLSLGAAGIWSTLGPFWAIPPRILRGAAAAAGIAMINSIGNLIGGFGGPFIMGFLKDRIGDYRGGLMISGGIVALASVLVLLVREPRRTPGFDPIMNVAAPVAGGHVTQDASGAFERS